LDTWGGERDGWMLDGDSRYSARVDKQVWSF
jgi:hypothetical protein